MGSRFSLQHLAQQSGRWVVFLALPLLVNGILWTAVVMPQRNRLRAWHDAHAIVTLRPQLATLLTDGQQAIQQWPQTDFGADDPSAPMQRIQRLAGAHHVKVSELQSGQAAPSQHATRPLELEVTGSFGKLAHWLSAVESQAGFRIERWTLSPGTEPGAPNHLTVKITALLGEV